MGLTKGSTGKHAVAQPAAPKGEGQRTIALAGNPNVGKSTVFNALTGLNQHTGNWPGKTVSSAQGTYVFHGERYTLVDLPGTYSLMAHSAEEEVARDFLCFGGAQAAVVVCDATCLERNLNLVLQTLEITPRVVVCVNLMDEAQKKGISLNLLQLSRALKVPVVGTSARSGKGLAQLMEQVEQAVRQEAPAPYRPAYDAPVEAAIAELQPRLAPLLPQNIPSRWAALRLLLGDEVLSDRLASRCPGPDWEAVREETCQLQQTLLEEGLTPQALQDGVVQSLVTQAAALCEGVVLQAPSPQEARERQLDRILTSRRTGIPAMVLLLMGILWLTIVGANVPSQLLGDALFWFQDQLSAWFLALNPPRWLHDMLILGGYRTLAWVVSVMLPPMAIFFPLFTLLEDLGYLPRVAFNLDHCFQMAHTCGKQALTMCLVSIWMRPGSSVGHGSLRRDWSFSPE